MEFLQSINSALTVIAAIVVSFALILRSLIAATRAGKILKSELTLKKILP